MTIHLNIGSNLGNRETMLRRAVEQISQALPGRVVCSDTIETPAWGYESEHPFLNIGVMLEPDTVYTPLEVLGILQKIQYSIDPSSHRDATGAYIDRAIDIDIIAIDDTVMESDELTLPHPRMHEREFVLRPMMQTAPAWEHPQLHLTPSQLLAAL